jgi:hypothetical protein
MRLSDWRASAPHKDATSPKISSIVDPVLAAFGAEPDPHCWVAWGDDPSSRYTILVPTDVGLISTFVRANIPGEGPRASAKLVRWSRAAIGELGLETQAGHRLLSFQVEQHVLRGVDGEADRVAAFALRVIAAVDGRTLPPVDETTAAVRRRVTPKTPFGTKASGTKTSGTKTSGTKTSGTATRSAGRAADTAAASPRR